MRRLKGLTNLLRARGGAGRSVTEAAASIEELEPASVEPLPRPAVLPGMSDRIIGGVPGFNTAAEALADLTATEARHAPVLRYTMRNCLLHPGGVEFEGGLWPRSGVKTDRLPLGRIEEVATGAYCMRPVSWQFFGHWVRDACTTALLAARDEELFLDARPDWPDAGPYAEAFGLKTRPPTAAFVETLHLFSDFSQGALKRRRYATLRDRLRAAMEPARKETGDLRPVYLRRGSSGVVRMIENEAVLADRLSRAGFDILEAASPNLTTLYTALSRASVIVTMEGSHLNHAHFAVPQGTPILVLIPGNRVSGIHRGISHAMGMRCGYVILEAAGHGSRVNPDEVLKTLDLLM